MGVYCFKISNHGAQHAVVTMHIASEAELVRIHAPSPRDKCIRPRPTHTHREGGCGSGTSGSTNVFHRHHSRQSAVHVQYPTTSCMEKSDFEVYLPEAWFVTLNMEMMPIILVKTAVMMVNKVYTITTYTPQPLIFSIWVLTPIW